MWHHADRKEPWPLSLMVLDIGNSQTVIGVYDGEQLLEHWRISTHRDWTADEHYALLHSLMAGNGFSLEAVRGAALVSVVPPATQAWQELFHHRLNIEPFILTVDAPLGIPVQVDHPREVGADRLANAVAARAKYGAPAIVVDFGTATTFDVVSPEGAFIGGAIAPGIATATEALFLRTAQLPRIALVRPRRVIGRNTLETMQSGIIYGFAGLVDGLVRRIQEELGGEARVIATGGLAPLMAEVSATIQEVDLFLTLDGVRMIYSRKYP
ncbi:MAG: type III pantothenate kinase [Clostridiales bacterium]|nr:type III pantothenate kinase [Clostridiales bacterium]